MRETNPQVLQSAEFMQNSIGTEKQDQELECDFYPTGNQTLSNERNLNIESQNLKFNNEMRENGNLMNQQFRPNDAQIHNYQNKMDAAPKLYNTVNISESQSFKVVNSLKARLQSIANKTNLNQMNIYNQEKKQQLTKSELKQLQKMSQNREIFQMLDRTTTNHEMYLYGKPRIFSATGSYHKSRSGSKTKSRLSSSKNGTRRTLAGSRNNGSGKFTTDSLSNYGTNYIPITNHSKKQSSHLSTKLNKILKKDQKINENKVQKATKFDAISNGHEFSSDGDQHMGVLESQNPPNEDQISENQLDKNQYPSVNQLHQFGSKQEPDFKIRHTSNQMKQKKRIMSAQNFGSRNKKNMQITNREKSIKQMYVNQSNSIGLPKVLLKQDLNNTTASLGIGLLDQKSSLKNSYFKANQVQNEDAESIIKGYRVKGQLYSDKMQKNQENEQRQDVPSFIHSNQQTTALSNSKQVIIQKYEQINNSAAQTTSGLDISNMTEQKDLPENQNIIRNEQMNAQRQFSNTVDPKTPDQDKLESQAQLKSENNHEQEMDQINFELTQNEKQFQPFPSQISKSKKTRVKSGNSKFAAHRSQNTVQNVYNQGGNGYPQQRIEMLKAPQFQIQNIKNRTTEVHKQNQDLRKQIERFDLQYKKYNNETKALKEKSQQCFADKFEIMRDLATYEVNHANNDPIRNLQRPFKQRILNLVEQVMIVKNKCSKNLKFDDEGDHYFTDSSLSSSGRKDKEPELYLTVDENIYSSDPNQHLRMSFGQQDKSKVDHQKGCLKSTQIDKIFNNLNQLQAIKRSRVNSCLFHGPGKQSVPACPSDDMVILQDGVMEHRLHAHTQRQQDVTPDSSTSQFEGTMNEQTIAKNPAQTVYKGRKSFNKFYQTIEASQGRGLSKDQVQNPKQQQVDAEMSSHGIDNGINQVLDERMSAIIEISGIGCLVQCSLLNGVIKGQVLSGFSERNYKFEMKPKFNQRFMAVDLREEVTRLFFDIVYNEHGEEKVTLNIRDPCKEGIKDQGKNFLVRLQGSQTQFQPLFLQQMKNGDIQLRIELFGTATSKNAEMIIPRTVVYEQTLGTLDLKELGLSPGGKGDIFLKEVSKQIESHVQITQKPDGSYQILGAAATAEFHKGEIETLYKSKYRSVFSKHSKTAAAAQMVGARVNHHGKKASEFVAAMQNQSLELGPGADADLINIKLYEIGAGVSRTEAHGHKRRGAASMDVRAVGDIRLSTQGAGSNHSSNDPHRAGKAVVFEKLEMALLRDRKHGRMRSSVHVPSLALSDLRASAMPLHPAYRSIDQLDRHLPKDIENTAKIDSEKDKEASKPYYAMDEQDQQRLANLKKEAEDEIMAEEDKDIEIYEALYGLRLLKAQRRYANKLQQNQKGAAFDVQTKNEQEMLLQKFSENINSRVRAKTRAEDLQYGRQKRRYFRQPKIYQNTYITELREKGLVLEDYEETGVSARGKRTYRTLYLFFREQDQAFLLLGRDEKPRAKGSKGGTHESDSGKSSASEISKTSSQLLNAQEMDDDSPYFVKINLNQQFLSHLDEPSIVDSHELMGPPHRCHIIMQNRVFKEIVQTEAHNMFNKNIESVLKRHLTQQYQQLAPVGAGLVADPEHKQKRYAAINEESSCNSGKELNDGKGSMSQLEHEKSIDTIDRGSTGGNLIDEIATPQSKNSLGGSKALAGTVELESGTQVDVGQGGIKAKGRGADGLQGQDDKPSQMSPIRSDEKQNIDDTPVSPQNGWEGQTKRDLRAKVCPRMRRLAENPSQIFERALDARLESFSVVLNYKS